MTPIFSFDAGVVWAYGHKWGAPTDLYFSPPTDADLVGHLCAAQRSGAWRTYAETRSAASSASNPLVHDSVTGAERPLHDVTVSVTFALHPTFGTGHIVGTNGDVTAFWDGEATRLVRQENLTPLRVVWGKAPSKREAFLDSL